MQVLSKERTTALFVSIKDLSKEQKADAPPPFIVVAEAMIENSFEIVSKIVEEVPAKTAISLYWQELQSMSVQGRVDRILADFRYCRFRRTFSKETTMLEVGLSPTISTSAETAWMGIKWVLKHHCSGKEMHGIAPRSNIERRIEFALKKLGVFR